MEEGSESETSSSSSSQTSDDEADTWRGSSTLPLVSSVVTRQASSPTSFLLSFVCLALQTGDIFKIDAWGFIVIFFLFFFSPKVLFFLFFFFYLLKTHLLKDFGFDSRVNNRNYNLITDQITFWLWHLCWEETIIVYSWDGQLWVWFSLFLYMTTLNQTNFQTVISLNWSIAVFSVEYYLRIDVRVEREKSDWQPFCKVYSIFCSSFILCFL